MENQNQEQLPALQKEVNAEIQEQAKAEKDHLLRLQRYSKLNNKKVEEAKLKEHPFIRGVKYLPISYMEMALDRIYFGLWNTRNYRWEVVMNELVGAIELEVFHPVAKIWLTRTGATALKIMTDSIPQEAASTMSKQDMNKWHLDTDNKKPNALEAGGFAHLKADCFRNAVLSLGKYFGRDANRKFEDEFTDLITDLDAEIRKWRKGVSNSLDLCQDQEMKDKHIQQILKAEEQGTNTPEFYQKIYFELNPEA